MAPCGLHMRVLVVDDEPEIVEVVSLCFGLRWPDAHVVSSDNGEDALRIAQKSKATKVKIDVLLTDMVMPGFSGSELIELLRNVSPELKVLFTSGYTDVARFQPDALPCGTDFLQKPYMPEALVLKLRQLLDR